MLLSERRQGGFRIKQFRGNFMICPIVKWCIKGSRVAPWWIRTLEQKVWGPEERKGKWMVYFNKDWSETPFCFHPHGKSSSTGTGQSGWNYEHTDFTRVKNGFVLLGLSLTSSLGPLPPLPRFMAEWKKGWALELIWVQILVLLLTTFGYISWPCWTSVCYI